MLFLVSTETSLTVPLGHPSLYLFIYRIHTNSQLFGIFLKYVLDLCVALPFFFERHARAKIKILSFYFVPPEGDWSEFYILTLERFLLSEGTNFLDVDFSAVYVVVLDVSCCFRCCFTPAGILFNCKELF